MSKLPPYYQGDLDCLCGVYSATNAAKLVHKDVRGDKACDLFYQCLKQIDRRKRLVRDLTGGVPATDLRALLRNVLTPEYEIKVRRPFEKARNFTLRPFLREVGNFLSGGQNRAVIVCFSAGWELPHWTVIKSVAKKYIVLLDSAGWNRISRKKLTTRKATTRKPFLFATRETYFLSNSR